MRNPGRRGIPSSLARQHHDPTRRQRSIRWDREQPPYYGTRLTNDVEDPASFRGRHYGQDYYHVWQARTVCLRKARKNLPGGNSNSLYSSYHNYNQDRNPGNTSYDS